ncbi:uncharacterized protein J7T54_001995 [Emericellopsis cladophorae]|uniref:Spindle pole body component n=1 Tax=Emericellopsis cladophorae TaxID=2686198 RepID=A0A9P9XXY7_9HYPO|nr:uncharacterized protein J7T54_001995 [Emericellopsis cladophorae]KAI6779907.1 hypothetical protein J7T54_001995 [Emericellopsis cladophorae]
MLHEILLSLSGHPSPLLQPDATFPPGVVTPSERQLLSAAAHLSQTHVKIINATRDISRDTQGSIIVRAVSAAVEDVHLRAFRRKVIEVEAKILNDDPSYVGAHNIVPLTAVVGEFSQWTRRMDWLLELMQFMANREGRQAAQVIDHLRTEVQSGYRDIEETAMSLVAVAEKAWLKQVSAWLLYGKLPNPGGHDFFVRMADDGDFIAEKTMLPEFVTTKTVASMLFIGKCLNHPKVKKMIDSGLRGLGQLSAQLRQLSSLAHPLDRAAFSRTITAMRIDLSETTLQNILPLSKVAEMLQLLRQFFLLGRGEFAMALIQEADQRTLNRWQRADNLAYEKGDTLKNITVKDGEVAAVLARTWAVLTSMQGAHAEEDEEQELARDLLRLHIGKTTAPASRETGVSPGMGLDVEALQVMEQSPFRDLLFSAPVDLSIRLPSPLDMVLTSADLRLYSCANAYLLSMRRAHIRLTDLWKISSLRRHHPAPKGASQYAVELRERWSTRMTTMRSVWVTASAALFFLGETEAYFQTEVVAVLWEGFLSWLLQGQQASQPSRPPTGATQEGGEGQPRDVSPDEDEDLWLDCSSPRPRPDASGPKPTHDPQTISTAHARYLSTLAFRLLLTQPSFTVPLHSLLVHIDHLVTHTRRLHSIFTSIDLETDAGVVDAFADLPAEEAEVTALLGGVEKRVKNGIGNVIGALRDLESDAAFMARWEGEDLDGDELDEEERSYRPSRVGGISRLLMKLDFGGWFGRQRQDWE